MWKLHVFIVLKDVVTAHPQAVTSIQNNENVNIPIKRNLDTFLRELTTHVL